MRIDRAEMGFATGNPLARNMGEKGSGIVRVDVKDLIRELHKAYADEQKAFYYYTWIAQNALSVKPGNVADVADKLATEEKKHADELAERIAELDGAHIELRRNPRNGQIVQPLNSFRAHRTDENG